MNEPPALRQIAHDECVEMIDYYIGLRETYAVHFSYVIIMRGMPGCGKSIFADCVRLYARARGLRVVICRADDFFETDDGYRWYREGISQAHAECFQKLASALRRHVDVIIIDNTNIRVPEFDRYVSAAEAANHIYDVVNFRCSDLNEAMWVSERGEHSVPPEVIAHRFNDFQQANLHPGLAFGHQHEGVMRLNSTWVEPVDFGFRG